MEKGGARKNAQVNLGGDLTGGQNKADWEEHTVGDGRLDIRIRQKEGCICGDGERRRPGGHRTPCGGDGRCGSMGLGDRGR